VEGNNIKSDCGTQLFGAPSSKRRNTLIPLFLLIFLNINLATDYRVHLKIKKKKNKTATATTTTTTTTTQQFSGNKLAKTDNSVE